MTRVLSVTSECVPLVKTGGLADVAGALPGALVEHGVEMRTLLPGYRPVLAARPDAPVVFDIPDLFGGPASIRSARLGRTVLYILDAPHLFDRDGSLYLGPDGYDWPDNPQRFAALSLAAAMVAAYGIEDWFPEILHLHDWQAGFTPVYLRELGAAERVKTLMTIHNIAFQGCSPGDTVGALGLPPQGFTQSGFEYWGQVSALKAGIVGATKVSTVSPTYAQELMTPEFGMGMEGVLAGRAADFVGILNGIDEEVWSPPYRAPAAKKKLKAALREELHLPESDGPLCVVVSRLTGQKGFDLLLEALPALIEQGGQLALLGSGDPWFEGAFRDAALTHPGVSVRIGYDEEFARRLIEAGDAILLPSRFEPCGLTQLYALRYGTLPLVSLTGGLADTVINANAAALARGVATGLQFHPTTALALRQALTRLCTLYRDPALWAKMARNAMAQPVGWSASAAAYAALFAEMTAVDDAG
ncbi:glycogen synthase GlgA [Celeribacter indicus]|uniref:Glycogen synthase n=1 Tax=Celeribacter indicus TaxID=1208324 RepID=A0A0B5E316_9RHOB|nr:glycogen synthase GlgA [Celeribacter indicus]AJE47780.1 glycogen synthase [Celeribacter indicus]SDW22627.1 starch synthase [Celeribacter indicus]